MAACTAVAVLGSAGIAGALDSSSLRLLLLGAQDMNTPLTILRADIAVTVEGPKGTRHTDAVAFFAPGKEARWYLQVRDPARAALVLGADRKVMERSDHATRTVAIGAPIDDLGIAYEDLSRFVADDFKLWQITDESAETVLTAAHPVVESAYVYRAYTIDKERSLILKAQFYAKALNNLVKLRTDTDHTLIGKKWMPGTIRIENFPDDTTTTLRLRWTQNATVAPELLVPASFPAASPVPWESATVSPSPAPPRS